ncbi:serine hydrolase domain-containing protein [Croceitalea sp. MTPC5]|uniref:serine hydrolase domain-containing protein n=1 Tax=Croceitalea sp. MTPC5 TaxID=3056565 RepID=UPI002B39BEA1|nr:serine hydrolase domain-containing protein [Croceitalea sp. MTPC5]
MKRNFLLLILISAINIGFTQTTEFNGLNVYFNGLQANNKFMGSVAIYKANKIVYSNQFGFKTIETKDVPDENTKYRIGSISKTFTAVLIFKAIEKGRLNLSETLDTYFPSIKNAKKITISNLLNHRSGIPSFTDKKDAYLSFNTQFKAEKEMITMVSEYQSDFEPDTQASYSNSNYLLLSYILEKVFDKSFGQIVTDEISKPLNLGNTYYAERLSAQNNEAYSFVIRKKRWKQETQTHGSIGLGAGSLVSTPVDLIQFSQALFKGKIISNESLKKMKTIRDKFGMGLFQTNYFDSTSFGHNSGIDGFVSMFRYFPENDMAFAVTSNGLDYDFNAIETVVVKSMFNKPFDLPIFSSYEHSSKQLNTYLGTYSSPSFPVKLKVTKLKKRLIVNVASQEPMLFDAYEKNKFKLDAAGMVIEFFPDKNEMAITQGSQTNVLQKE